MMTLRSLLTVLTVLLLPLAGCVSIHDHRTSGSYEDDEVSVHWDLRRGANRTDLRLLDVRIRPNAPVEEVEISLETDGVRVEHRRVAGSPSGTRERIRGLKLPTGSSTRLLVVAHRTDARGSETLIDSSITPAWD